MYNQFESNESVIFHFILSIYISTYIYLVFTYQSQRVYACIRWFDLLCLKNYSYYVKTSFRILNACKMNLWSFYMDDILNFQARDILKTVLKSGYNSEIKVLKIFYLK